MSRLKLSWPLGGLSETFAFDEQPQGTSRDMRNTRGKDARTGRLRGASRAGSSKFCSVPVGVGPVKLLQQVVYEAPNQTYSDQATVATTDWSTATPSKGDAKGTDLDNQSNLYVTDGQAGVAKFNSSGVRIWKIALPAKDAAHQCLSIRVQKSTGLVFAGISSGGKQETASLFCYQQVDDESTKLLWQIEPGGYVIQMRFYAEELYCLLNFPDRNRSYVRVYGSLLSTEPIQLKEWEVISNGADVDVSPVDGSVFVASSANAQRGLDPRAPGSTTQSSDWKPDADLSHWKERAWSWFDASDRESLQIQPTPQGGDEGGEVFGWIDKTGNGRSWLANHGISANPPVPSTEAGPVYKTVGVGGLPSLSFSGEVYTGATGKTGRSMVGQGASSTDRAFRAEQLSPLPTYKGAQFAFFMVIKAGIDDANIRGLLNIPTPGSNGLSRMLSINRRNDNNLPGTPPMPGSVSWKDPYGRGTTSDSGTSTPPAGGLPIAGRGVTGPLSGSGLAVITLINDGGVHDGNSQNGLLGLSSRCVLRVNGHPCDRWQTGPYSTTDSITLGLANLSSSGHARFAGLICEMICLSDWYDQNGIQQRLVSCPTYPDSSWAANGDTEVERIEGYLAHKWGMSHEMESGQAAWATFIGQPAVNETLTIDAKTYRFVNAFSQPNDVLRGSTTNATAGNLYQAINRIGNPGVDYDQRTEKHATFMAYAAVEQGPAVTIRMAIRSLSPYAGQITLANSSSANITWDNANTRLTIQGLGGENGWYPHPFTLKKTTNSRGGPPGIPTNTQGQVSTAYLLQTPYPALSKWSANTGKPMWVATSGYNVIASGTTHITTAANGIGGVGRSVRIGSEGQVFSVGDQQATVAGNEGILQDLTDIRRLHDGGESVSTAGADVWFSAVQPPGTAWESSIIHTDLDTFDNFYIPIFYTGAGPLATASILGYRSAPGPLASGNEFMRYINFPSHNEVFSVSVDQSKPDFQAGDTIQHSEFIYAGLQKDPGDTESLSIFKLRMIGTTSVSGSVRALKTIAVVAGSVYRVEGLNATVIGSGLDPAAQFIDSAVVLGKVFLTDGKTMLVYDPKLETLETYRPTSSGEFLPSCKLLASWNGRLVGARPANNAHNWFMTKQGDPFNCDIFPFTVTEAQAVEGADSRTNVNPDTINAIYAIRDDLMIFLCDHSVQRLTGDPMAGGSFHAISWATGGAFGRSGCMDPYGAFYFFSSRGGVYRMAPDGINIDSISVDKIQTRLEGLDLTTFRVELQWSTEEDGLHVFVMPFGSGGVQVSHYFWERSTQGWHVDTYGNDVFTQIQPTCSAVFDGDKPDDRHLVFGCEDGYVRQYDPEAMNDDGFPIESFGLIGPIVPDNEGSEFMFTDFEIVVDKNQQGPNFYLYASDLAGEPGDVIYHGDLRAGRNKILYRVRGAAVWLGIGSADPNATWAIESIAARAEPMGITRALG